jgi:hypothetical protein
VLHEDEVKVDPEMVRLLDGVMMDETTPPSVDVEDVDVVNLDKEHVTFALAEGRAKRVGPLLVLLMEVKLEEERERVAAADGRENRALDKVIEFHVTELR